MPVGPGGKAANCELFLVHLRRAREKWKVGALSR